jgi:hypothetical protein
MAVDPMSILREVNPQAAPADAPPTVANYRPADMQGVACAFCSKFSLESFKGGAEGEMGLPVGYCHQWESNVDGWFVCDWFASDAPTYDENGHEVWDMGESPLMSEIHFATGAVEEEGSGFVLKEVLRTGEWPVIPTATGMLKKPLKIIRDGVSSREDGRIALSELVTNFQAGIPRSVQVPLSDEEHKDHKNITRLNTGFVRDLWITDEGDTSKLVAKIQFTEPEIKEKTLRGTFEDVSCGIPWNLKVRGRAHGACLEHVCLTNKPFIDGLGPFLALSDDDEKHVEVEIEHFGAIQAPEKEADESGTDEAESAEHRPTPADSDHSSEAENESSESAEEPLTFNAQREQIREALHGEFGLSLDYEVVDIAPEAALVRNRIANLTWTVPFEVKDQKLSVSPVADWVENEETSAEPPRQLSELERARQLRELRLGQLSTTNKGGQQMSTLSLDGVELSDDQRAAIQNVLDENATLRKDNREGKAEKRVAELSELGLNERPGALKLYRQVFLSDDGGAAIVLLSDDGQEKERLTALDILDRFIEAVKGSDGKVVLSDQALVSGNDIKPPNDAEGEAEKPLEDRVADAKQALGLKK